MHWNASNNNNLMDVIQRNHISDHWDVHVVRHTLKSLLQGFIYFQLLYLKINNETTLKVLFYSSISILDAEMKTV